jgi:hypothetical protein
MIAFVRRVWSDGNLLAMGKASPPYTKWSLAVGTESIGGPNFIVLPDGRMVGGGRYFRTGKDPVDGAGSVTPTGYKRVLELPSGDNSYPGFVWHDGMLWTLYYSSHEDTAIAGDRVSK